MIGLITFVRISDYQTNKLNIVAAICINQLRADPLEAVLLRLLCKRGETRLLHEIRFLCDIVKPSLEQLHIPYTTMLEVVQLLEPRPVSAGETVFDGVDQDFFVVFHG